MKTLYAIALLALHSLLAAKAEIHHFSDKVIAQYSSVTFSELKHHKLVPQQYDYSCGAAALATILNYQFQIPVSERSIVEALLVASEQPGKKLREGFSLLDLKNFAESVGIEGVGYANLTIHELQQRNVPAIIPVNFDNINHFVVFKGIKDNYVYIGDPLWGNIVLDTRQFLAAWNRGIAFFLYDKARPLPNMLDYQYAYLTPDWKNAAASNNIVIRHAISGLSRF